MAGSSHFRRTQDAQPGFTENGNGENLIQLAISYKDDGGNANIKIYREGETIGDYTKGPIRTWVKGEAEALFGPRALIGGTAYGWVDSRVEDARIYDSVLSQDEIKNLQPDTLGVVVGGAEGSETWDGSGPESLFNAVSDEGYVGDQAPSITIYNQAQPGTQLHRL